MTKIAILETHHLSPPTREARISHWILCELAAQVNSYQYWHDTGGMQACRQGLLSAILSTYSKLVGLYEDPGRVCQQTVDCDPLALEKLIRRLKSARLYPLPKPATLTISVKHLLSTLRAIELTSLCKSSRKKTCRYTSSSEAEDEHSPPCHSDEEPQNAPSQI